MIRGAAPPRVTRWLPGLAAVLTLSGLARAVLAPPASAVAPSEPSSGSKTCTDSFPTGAARPKVTESFPAQGKSGWALPLEVTIEHGKGETVLPSGLGNQGSPDQLRALERAGFYLPSAKGDAAPRLERTEQGDKATSKVTISVVTLPDRPGRSELTLPPLPIAISRASGEVRTLCTAPHTVVVEDPIANTANPAPRGNPKPLRQREEWMEAMYGLIGAVAMLALFLLGKLLRDYLRRRPKPSPPPPPRRPPWEVALEELFDVRIAQLVEQERFAEHFDRVSDAVRRYLGARYGFDGLETTTSEAMAALRRVAPQYLLKDVESFLENADLVKFAKLVPSASECHDALSRAESLVRRTIPETVAPSLERAPIVPPGAGGVPSPSPSPARGTLDAKTGLPVSETDAPPEPPADGGGS